MCGVFYDMRFKVTACTEAEPRRQRLMCFRGRPCKLLTPREKGTPPPPKPTWIRVEVLYVRSSLWACVGVRGSEGESERTSGCQEGQDDTERSATYSKHADGEGSKVRLIFISGETDVDSR